LRKNIVRIALVLSLVLVGVFAMSGTALADQSNPDGNFLCPIVGNETAAAHNGQGWFDVAAGKSFFPGDNQAGAHANNNGVNTLGPGASPGPGDGNTEWSPIWPGS
jgi:hypothetical protein